MSRARRRPPGALLLGTVTVLLWAGPAGAAVPDGAEQADVRRALTLLNAVAEEYREGVADGAVVAPVEYEEAKLFFDEAQARLRGAAPAAAAPLEDAFAGVRADLFARAPLDQVRAGLDRLRAAVEQATGVTEAVFPEAPPSAARGQALFAEHCVACHGEQADGRGPDAARLDPPPANFTDPTFMDGETPLDFFHVITVGKGTSAMPAWDEVFSLQDRWDLVSYLWTVQPGHAGLAEGQGVYLAQCAGCHGAAGDGQGAYGASLLAPAPALDTPAALARQSDADLLAAVAHGVPGTPMPAYGALLSSEQMRAAVKFVRLLSLGGPEGLVANAKETDGAVRRCAGLLKLLGEEYQKAVVPGAAINEQEMAESQILLEQLLRQRARVEDALAADREAAAAFGATLDGLARAVRAAAPAADVAALATSAAQAIERRFPAQASADGGNSTDALAEARRLLDRALGAYRDGNPRAVYLVSDAYFQFDPIEKQLALVDPQMTRRVEARFAELRGLIAVPGNAAAAESLASAIAADFDAARAALAPRQSAYGVAVQSALIILREGFEVVLIVGALLAFVTRSGHRAMRRPILWGTAAGMVASLLTAVAFVQLFNAAGATAEVLEGATMLLASAVLFFVSYWLISKAEADRWQRYIQSKVTSALAAGNLLALGGAAFLAVYREGVETVLFYRALVGSAPDALAAVAGGFAAGTIGLAVLYALYMRLGRRLPMRQFFLATSALLYYLAFVFAGKGVAELQDAGAVRVTPVPGVPRLDAIGLYPTAESLAVQGLLLLCLAYALYATFAPRRRPVRAPVEVRDVRTLAAEMRTDLARLAERAPAVSTEANSLRARLTELEERLVLGVPPSGPKL